MKQSLPLSPFRSVPPEIMRCVFEELDRKSLLSLRFTCKEICQCVNPLAFRCLHVWFEEQSLQRLVNIARVPYLRACVKTLTFGLDAFYHVSHQQFRQAIDPDFYRFYNRGFPFSDQAEVEYREAAWPVYQRYYQLQQALEKSGRGSAMLIEAIGAFSSLCAIEFVDFQQWMGEYTRNGWNEQTAFIRKERRLQQHMLTAPTDDLPVPRGGHQLRVLVRALAATEKRLDKLSLDLWASNTGIGGLYSPLSADDQCLAVAAFASLRRLRLELEPIRTSVVELSRAHSKELSLTTIVRAATGLEHLDVRLPPFGAEGGCGFHWRNIVQIPKFGCLKTLRISGIILHESDFVAFLLQSCQGIHEFYLGPAKVIEDTWDLILKTVRGLKGLQVIDLDDLWYKCDRHIPPVFHCLNLKLVYDYLFKRTSDNSWRNCAKTETQGEQDLKDELYSDQSSETEFLWNPEIG